MLQQLTPAPAARFWEWPLKKWFIRGGILMPPTHVFQHVPMIRFCVSEIDVELRSFDLLEYQA